MNRQEMLQLETVLALWVIVTVLCFHFGYTVAGVISAINVLINLILLGTSRIER